MHRAIVLVLLAACGDDNAAIDSGSDGTGDVGSVIDGANCTACMFGAPMVAGTVAVPGATELSGLAVSRALADTLWAHNDSGDGPRVFAMSGAGASKGIVMVGGASAIDWEDLALGPCGSAWCLYVGDIGDNAVARANVQIYEVDEPAAIAGTITATGRRFDVAYPDGAHNAEALFVDPRDGATYVITKGTNPAQVFHMPRMAGSVAQAVQIGSFMIPSGNQLVTGADLQADACGVRLLVRTYSSIFEVRAGPAATIAELFAGAPAPVSAASEAQGETVALVPDGREYYTVSEGTAQALSLVSCP